MNFLNGNWFYLLLLLIPAVIILFARAAVRRRKLAEQLLGKQAERPGAVQASYSKRFLRMVLFLAALVCLVTAAARPWWGTRSVPAAAAGRDILILADVSKSMLAADVAPSRLAHEQYLIRELVERNKGDRFGLIAFAGNAFLACPLTGDATGFLQYAGELGVHSVPLGGTHLERALQTAADAFQAAEGPFRAVVLITDGDELAGDSRKVLGALKEKKIPLFIFGLGDPQVPALIPEEKGGYKRDSKGELVRTKLAEDALKHLALESGGIYVRSTAAESGLALVDRRIKALAPKSGSTGIRSIPIERFPYLLAAAFALLAGYFLITERKLAVLLLFCGVILTAAEEPVLPVQEKTAAGKPAEITETDPVKLYNQALQIQQSGKGDAAELYARAIRYSGKKPVARSYSFFNLGAARHGQAQEEIRQAEGVLQAQQLDAAQQGLQKALRSLQETGDLYGQALQQETGDLKPGNNLQNLADDLKKAEELLKKIEELKKQQEKTRQQTQDAQKQNQQKQDQKQQQDQQNSAAGQMRQARESAEKLQQQAQDLKQQKMAENAGQAAQDIRKAEEAKDRKTADKHLKDALQKLGQDQSQKKTQKGQDDPDQPNPQEGQNKQDQAQEGSKETPAPARLDKDSAAKLLEAMAGQEKELRDKLKERILRQQYKVEKDW